MEKKYADLKAGLVLLGLCLLAYFWLIPTQIKAKENAVIGPEFFPKLLVICCGICAAGVAFQGAMGLRKEGKLKLSSFGNPANRVNYKAYGKHALLLASSLVYLLVMPYTGFVIASVVFLTFLLMFFGHSKIGWCFLLSVVYVATIYFIFTVAFKISFPKGPLGF